MIIKNTKYMNTKYMNTKYMNTKYTCKCLETCLDWRHQVQAGSKANVQY